MWSDGAIMHTFPGHSRLVKQVMYVKKRLYGLCVSKQPLGDLKSTSRREIPEESRLQRVFSEDSWRYF